MENTGTENKSTAGDWQTGYLQSLRRDFMARLAKAKQDRSESAAEEAKAYLSIKQQLADKRDNERECLNRWQHERQEFTRLQAESYRERLRGLFGN